MADWKRVEGDEWKRRLRNMKVCVGKGEGRDPELLDGWLLGSGGEEGVEVVECGQLAVECVLLLLLEPEPLPAPQQGSVLEHGDRLGVHGPVGPLAGHVVAPGDLDEAVIEAEIVPQRVLPP